jgi:hypothetical protein
MPVRKPGAGPVTPCGTRLASLRLSLPLMNDRIARLCLIAAYCLMSWRMAVEVISHPEAKDHASSILGLGFCLLILIALLLLKPSVLVRVATALSGIIATLSLYIFGIYLLKHGAGWGEAKDLLVRALFTVVVPVFTVGYFIGNARANARASRISQLAEGPSASLSVSAAESSRSLIYDYGDRGARVLSSSVPFMMGMSLFMMLLAISYPFTSKPSGSVLLQAAFLFVVGAWIGLLGLHFRRDKQAFNTRYVLTESGVEVAPLGASPQSVEWSQIRSAYRSRLLRYFRLESPVTPDIVLAFGTPPRTEGTGQAKYGRTRAFLAEKLGDRLTTGWL